MPSIGGKDHHQNKAWGVKIGSDFENWVSDCENRIS